MLVYTAFNNQPRTFRNPVDIISCHAPAALPRAFARMEELLACGYWMAGFLSYEAGYGMDRHHIPHAPCRFPVLQMGCYRQPTDSSPVPGNHPRGFSVRQLTPGISREQYRRDISHIQAHIAAGDVYQITYCLKMRFSFSGSPWGLFQRLQQDHPMPYPAYIETGPWAMVSLSPELFLKKRGSIIHTKPMKGTWHRGTTPAADDRARRALRNDPKNRAENVMIADLMRNDLARAGGRVWVPSLFDVAPYATLFQMTSHVAAHIDPQVSWWRLFSALFPSGSVTGAPKLRAMEIIRCLEQEERHIYTGAIGYLSPTREAFFTVPIRTALIEGAQGELGVGCGIVADSTADGEWAESMLKAEFLRQAAE